MEDREHYVEVVEITVHEVPQEIHIRELETHRFGFEHGDQPLRGRSVTGVNPRNGHNYIGGGPKLLP